MATPLLPREHGTWAMLVVPWVVGVGLGGAPGAVAILLLGGALALFVANHHAMAWFRLRHRRSDPERAAAARRLAAFGTVGVALVAPAAVRLPRGTLVVLVAAAVALVLGTLALIVRRLDHALPGQVLAALGLTLTAPAAYYAAGGGAARVALAAWLLDAAFFLWAVLYVRLAIEARAARRTSLAAPRARWRFAAGTLVSDAALAVGAFAAVRLGGLPTATLAAFAPAAVQALAGVATLHHPAPLKRIGLLLLAHAIAFPVLLLLLS